VPVIARARLVAIRNNPSTADRGPGGLAAIVLTRVGIPEASILLRLAIVFRRTHLIDVEERRCAPRHPHLCCQILRCHGGGDGFPYSGSTPKTSTVYGKVLEREMAALNAAARPSRVKST